MEQVLQNESDFATYHVEGLIGRGGMSEVYRATNPRLDNKVALKLLAPELSEDESFRERFIRESRLAASLDHPNVVPIYDAGEWEGRPYIAMRFVDGPDLKQLIESRGPLPAEYTVGIVAQVGAGLDAAHDRGLIHRDVKPGNILIDEKAGDGSTPHVYLADFGVAKHRQSHSGLTSKGHYVGTIDYVAPEQIEGRELTPATDVYALGCVLFEALTGEPPFDRDSNVAMIFAHLSEPPPALSSKRIDLPAALDAVISKALAKKAEERYQSCRELVTAAREALASATSFAAPVAQATLASGPPETVLAGASAPAPPETVLAAAVQSIAPPPVPPTQLAGAQPPPAAPTAAVQQAADEPYTLRDRPKWRSRRRLVIAFVLLLLAAGSAVAGTTLIGGGSSSNNSGQNNENSSNSSSGKSGSALNPGDDNSNRRNRDKSSSSSSKSKNKSSSKSSSKSKSTTTSSSSSSNTRRTRTNSSSSSSSSSSTRRTRSSGSTSSSGSSSSSSTRRDRSGSSSSGSSSSGSSSSDNRRR